MTRILSFLKNENDLAKRLAKGEAKAQHIFYEKYSAKFLGICHRYIKDKMAAEDIMVESMMKIFDKIHLYDSKGSFEGWCKRLVINQSLSYLRTQKVFEIELADTLELNSAETDSLETQDLLHLIHELPSGYRTVFNLYAIEGYSHAEIAEMLQITEGTSKSQLSRARSFLQEKIKKNDLPTTSNFL